MDFLKTESLKDAAQQLNISSLEIHRLYKNPKRVWHIQIKWIGYLQ